MWLIFQILLTSIDAIERINQSGADNGNGSYDGNNHIEGSLVIRCKNLKIFQIDIRGHEKFKTTAESLDNLLSATVPGRTKSERSDSLLVSKISFDQVSTTGLDRTQKNFIAPIIIEANEFYIIIEIHAKTMPTDQILIQYFLFNI